ncbi:MAG: hypothetical protein NVS4B2_03840 [Chloroflexota bacterium]
MYRSAGDTSGVAGVDAVYRDAIRLFLRCITVELARDIGRPVPGTRAGPHTRDASHATGLTRGLDNGARDPRLDGANVPDDAMAEMETLARAVARHGPSPHALLTVVYQDLLSLSPRVDPRANVVSLERGGQRKARGVFYTPEPIARMLTEATLDALPADLLSAREGLPVVLDPAMGTGVFLLAVVHYLSERTGYSAAELAERCLHGFDVDALAIEVAIDGLCLETGARADILALHLRQGDALTENRQPCSYDAVLSNPPWGAVCGDGQQARLSLDGTIGNGRYPDSFELFLTRGAELTRGTMGMLVPQAVLSQSTYAPIRAVLVQRMDPYRAFDLGDGHFAGVSAPACGLVWGPKPGPAAIPCVSLRGAQSRIAAVPRARWSATAGFPCADAGLLDMIEHLQTSHPTMGDLADVYRVHDTGINYNRAALARRVMYESAHPEHPDDIPRYRGRNFGRYTVIRREGWLRHNARGLVEAGERLSINVNLYRQPEKIVFRQTADRIVATLDCTRMAFGRSVIAATARGNAALLPLLACLNSSLMTALYRGLTGEHGRVLAQVKVGRVLLLPIPSVCRTPIDPALRCEARTWKPEQQAGVLASARETPLPAWAWLEYLVERHLATGGQDARLEAAIDEIVCALYGVAEPIMDILPVERATRSASCPPQYDIGPRV